MKHAKHTKNIIALFVILSIAPVVYGCSGNSATATTTLTPASTSALQIAAIQALTGEGCLQLAKRHPDRIAGGMSDLAAAQSALDGGKLTYGNILNLALNHVKVDPQSMVIVQPAIYAITSQVDGTVPSSGKSLIPVKGSQAYATIQAGITGCRTGLMAAGS